MTRVISVALRRMLDSRGNPTVGADMFTESGGFGRAVASSGVSTGGYEAIELPPTEAIAAARQHTVLRLVDEVRTGNQRKVDVTLRAADGSENFSEIGANSAITVSVAAAEAGANVPGAPLYQHLGGAFHGGNFPTPLGNVIGDGERARETTGVQEFLAAPIGASGVFETVFTNAKTHARAPEVLDERGVPTAKDDGGAWAPPVPDAETFEIMGGAIPDVGGGLGFEIGFGLDIAASEMFEDGVCHYGDETKTTDEQIDYIAEMIGGYDLVYIENPLDENDYEGFVELTERVGNRTLICGDDLFVTNVDRLQDGIDVDATDFILIKPNRIEALIGAFDTVELASRNGMGTVIPHRSGEAKDATITHLAVVTDAPFVKTGTVQNERTVKLDGLIRIADNAV